MEDREHCRGERVSGRAGERPSASRGRRWQRLAGVSPDRDSNWAAASARRVVAAGNDSGIGCLTDCRVRIQSSSMISCQRGRRTRGEPCHLRCSVAICRFASPGRESSAVRTVNEIGHFQ
jgi:hypothetical protein